MLSVGESYAIGCPVLVPCCGQSLVGAAQGKHGLAGSAAAQARRCCRQGSLKGWSDLVTRALSPCHTHLCLSAWGALTSLFSASFSQGGQWDKLQSPWVQLVTSGTPHFPFWLFTLTPLILFYNHCRSSWLWVVCPKPSFVRGLSFSGHCSACPFIAITGWWSSGQHV